MAEMAKDGVTQNTPGASKAGLNGFFSDTVAQGQLAHTRSLFIFLREQSAIIFVQCVQTLA